ARDSDWQVRRFAARRIDPQQAENAAAWQALTVDRAFQVRFEVVAVEARLAARSHDCTALLKTMTDQVPVVAMRAMDGVPVDCQQPEMLNTLKSIAVGIGKSTETNWHLPTRAVVALARLKVNVAMFLPAMVGHDAWQVRAAAATIAGQLGLTETARQLAGSGDP